MFLRAMKHLFLLLTVWPISPMANQSHDYANCTFYPEDSMGSCGYSCLKPISESYLISLAKIFPHCRSVSFYLTSGRYHSIPANLFSRAGKVQHIFLEITNVTFEYFFDPSPDSSPFRGVIFDTSFVLYVVNSRATKRWNWGALSELHPVKGGVAYIEVYNSNIVHLTDDFSRIVQGAVNEVRFSGGNLQSLDDGVFASFSLLKEVFLHDNRISLMKRNYFPRPATVLENIVLKNNKIRSFPLNMFLYMPLLKNVDLSGNQLITIDEAVFRPIISKIVIGFPDIPLHCDCKLRWLKYAFSADGKHPSESLICRTPLDTNGTYLAELSDQQLGC